jgi:hypothetical protein
MRLLPQSSQYAATKPSSARALDASGDTHQRNENVTLGVELYPSSKEAVMRGFIIGVLVVVVGVLGYLYWDSEHNTLFRAPGVEIKKN